MFDASEIAFYFYFFYPTPPFPLLIFCPSMYELLCPLPFVVVSRRVPGYKWEAGHLWAIWSDLYSSLMVSYVRLSLAELSLAWGTCKRKLHHFGNMEGPLMKDFQEKGIILLCFIYILGGSTANRPWFSLSHTPTHRHTHLRSIHTMHGANFPDDKHNLRDASQTSWRQAKRKSIHQPRSSPAHPGNDKCVSSLQI